MADVPPGVKGMNDILAPEVSKWQFLEQKARDVLEAFAYRELRTPVLEYTPLFVRSVGEVTDVVEKQMYTFDDRDGRSVSLRPEGTASAVRAYVENAQWNKEPVTRWYYIGPMFRHERAQRGRLRQFHQVGAEVFGVDEPSIDAEMIAMLVDDAGATSASPAARSRSTSTRWASPRSARPTATRWSTTSPQHRDKLDDDSRRRLETNPLRILDSKNPDVHRARRGRARCCSTTLSDGVAGALRARARAARRAGRAAPGRPAPRARARLLHGHDLRDQDEGRRARRAEHRRGRRPLRPPGRVAGRTEHARRSASRWASSGRCSRCPSRAESYEPALAVFFAPMDAAALDFALPIVHRLRGKGIRVEIEHRAEQGRAR